MSERLVCRSPSVDLSSHSTHLSLQLERKQRDNTGNNMTKYLIALLALVTFAPEMAAQCQAVKNTGSIANPSSDAGRCENEGGYCYLGGKDYSKPEGKCVTSGGPGTWTCGCSMNGVASPYFALNGGILTTFNSPPGMATGSIGVISVNGFSGTVNASCQITASPNNTSPSCSVNPPSQPIGPSGGLISLSVPTQGLVPGDYSVQVSATGSSNSVTLHLSIPTPKASGGTTLALISFAALFVIWTVCMCKGGVRRKFRQQALRD